MRGSKHRYDPPRQGGYYHQDERDAAAIGCLLMVGVILAAVILAAVAILAPK